MFEDAAVVNVDPGAKLVGEPDGISGEQRVDVGRRVGWGLVVVRDAQAERQPERPFHGRGRDPGQAGHAGLNAHYASSAAWPSRPCGSCTGRPPTMVNTGPR